MAEHRPQSSSLSSEEASEPTLARERFCCGQGDNPLFAASCELRISSWSNLFGDGAFLDGRLAKANSTSIAALRSAAFLSAAFCAAGRLCETRQANGKQL